MKRGRRLSLIVAGAAVVVAVAALALLTREQPPYDFLCGATYIRTEVFINSSGLERAYVSYKSPLCLQEVYPEACDELLPKGWRALGGTLASARHSGTYVSFYSNDLFPGGIQVQSDEYIEVNRAPTAADRLRAWLDRVTGR